jgi:hypothetical protein
MLMKRASSNSDRRLFTDVKVKHKNQIIIFRHTFLYLIKIRSNEVNVSSLTKDKFSQSHEEDIERNMNEPFHEIRYQIKIRKCGIHRN